MDEAILHARAEIDALRAAASAADAVTDDLNQHCSIHEVEQIGRYAIPFQSGWAPLLTLVNDRAVGIHFSTTHYPTFDAVLAHTFDNEALVDAHNPDYETRLHVGLRENIAAVRNFLLQLYYAETPEGMTAEQAAQALQEIATYVGDGLHNSMRLGIMQPHHDPSQPFIDMAEASYPNGAGAQYIYEKILEMDRQSNWVRPFSAIVALFGGKTTSDWLLPPADATPFHAFYDQDLMPGESATVEEIDAALEHLDTLEAQRRTVQEHMAIAATATDLDAMGSHLIYTAENLRDVQQMSEPVRQDAIEIAKDILRKLKISIGELHVLDGLGLKPRDDLSTVSGIKAVALVYERLLAWGRGIDPSIMQHPNILAATLAIGQIGALAKREALKVAMLAGNTAQAQLLEQQLKAVPGAYTKADDEKIAVLLDHVERGIDTVLNRVVTITGPNAMVGHSRSNELGNYMSGTPIAGMALQASAEGVNRTNNAKQQNQIQEGVQQSQRAQVQRVTQQIANQSRSSGVTPPASSSGRGSASAQIAVMRQRLTQARRTASTNQAQIGARTNSQRLAAMNIHGHHDEHHDQHHGHPPDPLAATLAKLDPRIMNNIKQMNNTTAGLTNNPVITGRAAFDKMRQANTYGLKAPATPQQKPMTDEEKKKQQQQALNPPPPPKKDGRSL